MVDPATSTSHPRAHNCKKQGATPVPPLYGARRTCIGRLFTANEDRGK
jgi:hypothetical protein